MAQSWATLTNILGDEDLPADDTTYKWRFCTCHQTDSQTSKKSPPYPIDSLAGLKLQDLFLDAFKQNTDIYQSFYLFTREIGYMDHFNNSQAKITNIAPFVGNISHTTLNPSWSKVDLLEARFGARIEKDFPLDNHLLLILDASIPQDGLPPKTRIPLNFITNFSVILIEVPYYVTCSILSIEIMVQEIT